MAIFYVWWKWIPISSNCRLCLLKTQVNSLAYNGSIKHQAIQIMTNLKYFCLSVCEHFYQCICLSVSLSVCLSVKLYICQFIRLSVCLPVCLFTCLSVCQFIRLSVSLSVCLSVDLSVRQFICLSVSLSVCLSFYLSVCQFICLSILTSTPLLPAASSSLQEILAQVCCLQHEEVRHSRKININDPLQIAFNQGYFLPWPLPKCCGRGIEHV